MSAFSPIASNYIVARIVFTSQVRRQEITTTTSQRLRLFLVQIYSPNTRQKCPQKRQLLPSWRRKTELPSVRFESRLGPPGNYTCVNKGELSPLPAAYLQHCISVSPQNSQI